MKLQTGDIIEYLNSTMTYGIVYKVNIYKEGLGVSNAIVKWNEPEPGDTTTESLELDEHHFKYICNVSEIKDDVLKGFAIAIKYNIDINSLMQFIDQVL
jgi:hypothetical protein